MSNLITVRTPNGGTMASNQAATIDLSHLPLPQPLHHSTTTATILPTLKQPLLSLGQFCDHGYEIKLTKEEICMREKSANTNWTTIGKRNKNNGLWDIPLADSTQTQQ